MQMSQSSKMGSFSKCLRMVFIRSFCVITSKLDSMHKLVTVNSIFKFLVFEWKRTKNKYFNKLCYFIQGLRVICCGNFHPVKEYFSHLKEIEAN